MNIISIPNSVILNSKNDFFHLTNFLLINLFVMLPGSYINLSNQLIEKILLKLES